MRLCRAFPLLLVLTACTTTPTLTPKVASTPRPTATSPASGLVAGPPGSNLAMSAPNPRLFHHLRRVAPDGAVTQLDVSEKGLLRVFGNGKGDVYAIDGLTGKTRALAGGGAAVDTGLVPDNGMPSVGLATLGDDGTMFIQNADVLAMYPLLKIPVGGAPATLAKGVIKLYDDKTNTPTRFAFRPPVALTPDGQGGVYLYERNVEEDSKLLHIDTAGRLSTVMDVAGGLPAVNSLGAQGTTAGLVMDGGDTAHPTFALVDGAAPRVVHLAPGGSPAMRVIAGSLAAGSADGKGEAAGFKAPEGLARAADGTLVVSDGGRVRAIAPDGTVTTRAADDNQLHPGEDVLFGSTRTFGGIALDAAGNAYVADNFQEIVPR